MATQKNHKTVKVEASLNAVEFYKKEEQPFHTTQQRFLHSAIATVGMKKREA